MRKVAIVDGCSLFRSGLKALLKKSGEYEICCEISEPADIQQSLRKTAARTLVLDPYFVGNGCGLTLIERIRRQFPKLPLLVCTWCLQEDLWLSAMQSGAQGFILKNCSDAEMINALRKIHAGENYFMDDVKERVLKMFMQNRTFERNHGILSQRQRQVLERFLEGEQEKEIAAALGIGISSVATYLARIVQRLGVKNKIQLIRFTEAHPELLRGKPAAPSAAPPGEQRQSAHI